MLEDRVDTDSFVTHDLFGQDSELAHGTALARLPKHEQRAWFSP